MSDQQVLLSMGFTPDRVDWALKATANRGLQPAMDHILENEGNPVPDLSAVITGGGGTGPGAMDVDEDEDDADAMRAALKLSTGESSGSAEMQDVGGATAKSIKCSECGKIFRDTAMATFHGEKSGHDQFEESTEEITPLTEEEKKQKLEDLRIKMAEKRQKKAAEEAKENKANESLRRKAGKDQAVAKQELEAKQLAKDAAEKKREKVLEAEAKAKIRAQIEADKKARAEKAAKEKALREGREYTDASGTIPAAPIAAAATPSVASGTRGVDYKDTRLQIRLAAGGAPITMTIPSDKTLQDVATSLATQTAAIQTDTVTFATTFPRKTFTRGEFGKTLKELGLTPSAVLQAS